MKIQFTLPGTVTEAQVEAMVQENDLVTLDGDFFAVLDNGDVQLNFQPYFECELDEWLEFIYWVTVQVRKLW